MAEQGTHDPDALMRYETIRIDKDGPVNRP